MAITFYATADTGMSLSAVVQIISPSGGLGNIWDDVNTVFAAAPTDNNSKIALAELTGIKSGTYVASRASLASQTGDVLVFIVNNTTGKSIGSVRTRLVGGSEIEELANNQLITTLATAAALADVQITADAAETNTDTLINRLTATRAGFLDQIPTVNTNVTTVVTTTGAIVADTNELQTDWVNGGRLDALLDTILADTAELQTDWVNGGRLDLLVDSILADTNELQVDWANGGRLDLIVDATLADTNELQTDWANGGRLDLLLDSAVANSGGITLGNLVADWEDGGRLDLLVDQILADTNEVQTDLVNGGRIDLLIDSILADTNELQTDWADLGRLDVILDATLAAAGGGLTTAAIVSAIDATSVKLGEIHADLIDGGRIDLLIDGLITQATTIIADTNELQVDWVNGGRLDLIVDAILADTNEMQGDWASGGRLDTALDLAAAGGSEITFATEIPPPQRLWKFLMGADSSIARNIVRVAAGSEIDVGMDFSGLLADETGLVAPFAAIEELDDFPMTITDVRKSQDSDSIIFHVSNLVEGGRYRLRVSSTTTTGQVIAGIGFLEAE